MKVLFGLGVGEVAPRLAEPGLAFLWSGYSLGWMSCLQLLKIGQGLPGTWLANVSKKSCVPTGVSNFPDNSSKGWCEVRNWRSWKGLIGGQWAYIIQVFSGICPTCVSECFHPKPLHQSSDKMVHIFILFWKNRDILGRLSSALILWQSISDLDDLRLSWHFLFHSYLHTFTVFWLAVFLLFLFLFPLPYLYILSPGCLLK